MIKQSIPAYWKTFQATLPPHSPVHYKTYIAESFGDSPALADELGGLIVQGIKTATCSALWEYQVEGESLPCVGQITIVLDGQEKPLCIIETTEVSIRQFNEIDAQFAYDEGEGDRSLEYWRQEHWKFFSRSLVAIGMEPSEEMPLVCERFRMIY